ncbi:hypothetical protein BAMA_14610 [Bacillus manliponensis]|uniref:Cytoplasmic protein n=1 Tax=Bacillus manliponensis TaxID=574376 RepID=A0A073JZZ5_9BACI|nr:hypothetical protein [Bacillus manliponensis]KEK20639.1 hypothetical protein BAMA_14610 [Bacillus manliponensis]
MNKQQYNTIMWKIEQEKEQILKEIHELTEEKRSIEKKKEYDRYVVTSRSMLKTGMHVSAGMLSSHTFSPERMEEWNRKIEKINSFIQKNENLLEQMKEKERVIENMFQENTRLFLKQEEQREEKQLLDLKMCMNG